MKRLVPVSLCCLLAGSTLMAQRGGGSARGAAFVGGGIRGGFGGGFRGGLGFRGGFQNGFGFNRGFRGFGFGFYGGYWPYYYYPYLGWGYAAYWPDYGYPSYYSDYGAYDYGYAGYAGYRTAPNVTVIYPPQTATQPLPAPGPLVVREYDQYGQPAQPPLYLVAFKDHTIRAASSYRVDGMTLHYVTPQGEEQSVPLDTVDRDLSLRLNRERRVPFQLPPQ